MSNQRRVIIKIESTSDYGRRLQRGIANYARLHSNWFLYRSPPPYIPSGGRALEIERIRKWKPTGIIIREVRPIPELLELDIPTIVSRNIIISPQIKKQIQGKPVIVTDCKEIGYTAAEYLLNRKFKNFAFCGYSEATWSQDRFDAFSKKISNAGFATHIFKSSFTKKMGNWEKEIEQIAHWLKSLPKPLAILACNDIRASDVLDACHLNRSFVPEEIAVMGVDNDATICDASNPSLTSVAIDAEKAGYEAAELLEQMMSDKKCPQEKITVKPTLVVTRQSTDIMAIEDAIISAAVHFIHQNTKKQLRVIDVVENLAVSRRFLEVRFKNIVGRSIYNEIKRAKTEKIIQLLVETHSTISEIARDFGFIDVHNMSRYFRATVGMSLVEYRKRHTIW